MSSVVTVRERRRRTSRSLSVMREDVLAGDPGVDELLIAPDRLDEHRGARKFAALLAVRHLELWASPLNRVVDVCRGSAVLSLQSSTRAEA